MADFVAKVFLASGRETLIQNLARARNVDSRTHSPRFDYFKFQFYRAGSETFATKSAHRVGSSRRTDSVAIEGIADIRQALLPVGATRLTQTRHEHRSPEQQCSEEVHREGGGPSRDHYLFRSRCAGLLGRTGTLLIRVRSVREAPVKYPFLR